MAYLLGIDAGTSVMKAVLYDERGTVLAEGADEYSLLTPSQGIVETDPGVYWSSLKTVLARIFSQADPWCREITALAISSQGESFIPIDSSGHPLRNTIVWLDSRSKQQARDIAEAFGVETIYHTTGSPQVDTTWASTKLLWLRENEPDLFKTIHKVLFVEDYLIYRLTGTFAANGALYCSSLLYDIHRNSWWDRMLEYLGLSRHQLPELYPSGVQVGRVRREIADELGFSNRPAVVTGGMDQACGCIGSGNIRSGVVTENTGTSLNISVTVDRPVFDPKRRVPLQTHALAGKYIYLPWCVTGGMVLRWFRDTFCEEQVKQAEATGENIYDVLTRAAESIEPGSEGVIILPHLSGAMSPEMDPNARGVIYGLNLATRREHLIRGIMESIAYMCRANIDLVAESGIDVKQIILTGGTSYSRLWNQIKSDVLGKEVKTITTRESGCLGAAILAGLGSGIYDSAEQACELMIKEDESYYPDHDRHAAYEKYYARYQQLYTALKPLFEQSASL